MPAATLRLVSAAAPLDQERIFDATGALVDGLREGRPAAQRRLLQQQGPRVERILVRVLGSRLDLDDLAQEVFLRVFDRIGRLRDPAALAGFVAAVTVLVAREAMRSRRRRRWLVFGADPAPVALAPHVDAEARAAVRAFYEVLGHLGDEERVVFCLRHVEGMEMREVAEACATSESTVRRRLRRAEARFSRLADQRGELANLLKEGCPWPRPTT